MKEEKYFRQDEDGNLKELEKSIKWLSNVNNFKNVSRYSKEYFEHFNKVVKALKQAQKQEKLLELYKKLSVIRNKIISLALSGADYGDMETIEMDIEKQIKEKEND